MNARCPYYELIPKDRGENLRWRAEVRERAMVDEQFRAGLAQMCADDPLFFINGFCWCFEPRNLPPAPRMLPFICWDDQEKAVLEIRPLWGKKPFLIIKSREQGATWLLVALERHSWLFEEQFTCGITSKDEASVDTEGDLATLMPKMDFIVEHLPKWMQPKSINRTQLKSVNEDLGCTTKGHAATADAGRSGRTSVWIKDESAAYPKGADYRVNDAIQYVTNCQIDISTPQGDVGAFFDRANDPEIHKIVMDWKNNPVHNRGLYDVLDGEPFVVDANNPLAPEYLADIQNIHRRLEAKGFKVEGTRRSPWYNTKCLESRGPVSIEQELNMSFGRSAERPYDRDKIELLVRRHARSPNQTGMMKVAEVEGRIEGTWRRSNGGNCKLWSPLGGPTLAPPKRAYAAGVDVSFGTGGEYSSNSVLIVGDLATGEQVFEFVSSTTMIPEFAKLVTAVCKWFWNATLNWDSAGPAGKLFTRHILEHCKYYEIIYTSDAEGEKKPGTYHHDEDSKPVYLGDALEDALCDELILRSESTINEFGQYGFKNGKVVHIAALRTLSEGAKGRAHGDRATAAAMFNIVRRQLKGTVEPTPDRPPGIGEPWRRVPWACSATRLIDKFEGPPNSRRTGPYADRPRPHR